MKGREPGFAELSFQDSRRHTWKQERRKEVFRIRRERGSGTHLTDTVLDSCTEFTIGKIRLIIVHVKFTIARVPVAEPATAALIATLITVKGSFFFKLHGDTRACRFADRRPVRPCTSVSEPGLRRQRVVRRAGACERRWIEQRKGKKKKRRERKEKKKYIKHVECFRSGYSIIVSLVVHGHARRVGSDIIRQKKQRRYNRARQSLQS